MPLLSMSSVRQAGLALSLGLALVAGNPAVAQTAGGLPEFTPIVEKVDPGVVNIRTTASVRVGRPGGGGGGGGGTPDPYEMFRWFFGPDFNPPGMPPRGERAPRATPPGSGPDEQRSVPRGVGSGFFISDDGYILTNHHVIDGADGILVTLTDGRELKAKVIGSDQRTDVALIKVETKDAPALQIGDPANLKKGGWVLAFGSPFGLDSTVTAGIVSAIGRDTGDYLPFIQTDVAVNPGNSGGPLVNMQGQVVGINSQIVSRSGGFMGISLAIPIDDAMRVVEQLRSSGRVVRGRIGVAIGDVSDEVASALGLSKSSGALVRGVEPGSPAEKAGVEAGDVITRFNGQEIAKVSDLPRMVGNTKPGTAAGLEVWRRGKTVKLELTVDTLDAETPPAAADSESKEAPAAKANALGLTVTELSKERQKALRVNGGVLVKQAEGAAARAGIAEGDVILVVGDTDITSVRQFEQTVEKLDKSRTYPVLVRRDDATQWVPLRPAR